MGGTLGYLTVVIDAITESMSGLCEHYLDVMTLSGFGYLHTI